MDRQTDRQAGSRQGSRQTEQHDAPLPYFVSGLTVAFVPVLNVLPEQLLVEGMALAGHVAGLSCGLLQDQTPAVVTNAPHHIQPPRGAGHDHLILHMHGKQSHQPHL